MKNEFVRMRKEAFDPTFFLGGSNIQNFKNQKSKIWGEVFLCPMIPCDGKDMDSMEGSHSSAFFFLKSHINSRKPSGYYIYHPLVTICTTQWLLYVPLSGYYMYHPLVTTCTTQWLLYVPPTGYYMYHPLVTICTTHWLLYVPPGLTLSSYVLPTERICVFCMDLRTNSKYFPIQYYLNGDR
jgi:hypothetical protein